MRGIVAGVALCLALTGCRTTSDGADLGLPDLPAGTGPIAGGEVLWAVDDTIHAGDRTIPVGKRVHAMVEAHGRIYLLRGRSDTVLVTDGGKPRPTGLEAEALTASEDGRYLGLLETSEVPWSVVVVDLESGEVVVRDDTGMGEPGDDLGDLYEDAQPRVLGFDGDELFVETATGSAVTSWEAATGERTGHDDDLFYFPRPDPGGGQALPALVRRGRLVVPRDPYRSTQRGHVSPDGAVAVMPVGDTSQVFDVASGRRLPVDLQGRRFILGGWTDDATAYGLAVDGSAFGPRPVRLVSCRLTVEQRGCEVLRTIRPPDHQLVLFPTGSAAADY